MDRRMPSCCRRLFPEDAGGGCSVPEIPTCVAEERQRNRERWNFDFEKGVPLEGRYEWTRVGPPSPPSPAAPPEESVAGRPRPGAVQEGAPDGEGQEGEEAGEEEGQGGEGMDVEVEAKPSSVSESDGEEDRAQR